MTIERWRPFGSSLARLEPFRELGDIQGEMNRLFDSFFGRPTAFASHEQERMWAPAVDVYETKDDLVVTLEIPGVQDKEVGVSITGDMLTVRGERKARHESKDDGYHRMERVYGKFERTLPLPMPVEADKVKATYRDGVLEIKLPKAEAVKPKEIKIDIL